MSALPHLVLSSPAHTTAELDSTVAPTQKNAKSHAESQYDQGDKHAATRRIPPGLSLYRPENTPPASPTTTRPIRMGAQDMRGVHHGDSLTPPVTPICASHEKSDSELLTTPASHIRTDSAHSVSNPFQSGNVEVVAFPFQSSDYEIQTDDNQKKKLLGTGVWSDVYLATPCPAKPVSHSIPVTMLDDISPPITRIQSHDSVIGMDRITTPALYAIKVPASRSAQKVLTEEARILSHLTRFPDSSNHVLRFFGQDPRTYALVLEAMDGTLESWIQGSLNTLPEPERAAKLAAVFPAMALSLIDSLRWMQSKSCTHADIKPGNILISSMATGTGGAPRTVYSDFSSSTLHMFSTDASPSPLGAGTWDYLDPSLLSSLKPASPSAATDLWSLAITLLYLIVGASPFDALKANTFQPREMIKQGAPLACMAYGDEGIRNMRRFRALESALGFSLVTWLGRVFVKDIQGRVGVDMWRKDFVDGVGGKA
jgi:hypothetical protein